MANITITVAQGLVMADAPLAPSPNSEQDYVTGDLNYCVERIKITFTQGGTRTINALAGSLDISGVQVTTALAVRGIITVREIDAFGGYLKTTDHKFRLSRRDLDFIPKSGDKAESDGRIYEVIGVDEATFRTAIGIYCRG